MRLAFAHHWYQVPVATVCTAAMLYACSPNPGTANYDELATKMRPDPLWRAHVNATVNSKAFYPLGPGRLEDYKEVSPGTEIDIYGFNEDWVLVNRSASVYLPRDSVDLEIALASQPKPYPLLHTRTRQDVDVCQIQTVNQDGSFATIGYLEPDQPVEVYGIHGRFALISPWLHWAPADCFPSFPEELFETDPETIAGLVRSFRDANENTIGSVVCYENGEQAYLGYGTEDEQFPYQGPRDGSECAKQFDYPRWESPQPRQQFCTSANGCQDAELHSTPFLNRAELLVLHMWMSLSGKVVQEIEYGPTGGGRIPPRLVGRKSAANRVRFQRASVGIRFHVRCVRTLAQQWNQRCDLPCHARQSRNGRWHQHRR